MAYYRNVIQVEILSDRPWTDEELDDLGNVDYQTDQGDAVGHITTTVRNQALDRDSMIERLDEAGSDIGFFDEREVTDAD